MAVIQTVVSEFWLFTGTVSFAVYCSWQKVRRDVGTVGFLSYLVWHLAGWWKSWNAVVFTSCTVGSSQEKEMKHITSNAEGNCDWEHECVFVQATNGLFPIYLAQKFNEKLTIVPNNWNQSNAIPNVYLLGISFLFCLVTIIKSEG